ncbi:hypothetical protein G9A89_013060 [Geosiphon pyriformis]|nr:hypothetical protein G9A89_013060 [Geosiphon pyriformis]
MLFKAAFNRALKRLQYYSYDKDELYNTAQTKVREGTAKEIQHWKESAEVADEVASYNMFDPVDKFQNYYQQLCPIRQEQEQYLAQINTYFCENCLILCQNQCCEDLAKKGISIQGGVIDSKYTGNLMVLLQNNSEKPYTIESKKKIAQAIFLPLVKIGKLVLVENCEELLQTTKKTFGFRSTGKRIETNFAKTIEEKGKVIKTEQSIMLLPYEKSEIRIKKTIKKKDLIFEPYPKICQQFFIELTNLFIPADKTQWIKIPIANTTEESIYILEDTIIGYLGTELENVSIPQEILNFPEIALYCELTSINWQQLLECYQFMPEKLAKLNIGTMDLDQQTNLVQHQIPTGDARPKKQCAYHVPPMEHNFIREEVQSMLEKEIIQLSMSP